MFFLNLDDLTNLFVFCFSRPSVVPRKEMRVGEDPHVDGSYVGLTLPPSVVSGGSEKYRLAFIRAVQGQSLVDLTPTYRHFVATVVLRMRGAGKVPPL